MEAENSSSPNRLEYVFIPVFFALATIAVTWPLVPHADRFITDYGDSLSNLWCLGWNWFALFNRPLDIYNANIFHPFPNALATLDHLFGILPFAMITRLFGASPITAYNLANAAALWLSGLTMYCLARNWTGSFFGALAAGVVFAFHPVHLFLLHQIQVSHAELLPLLLLSLDRFVNGKGWRWWWIFSILFFWNILMSFYIGYMGCFVVLVWSILELSNKRKRIVNKRTISGGALFLLFTAVSLLLVYRPYFAMHWGDERLSRSVADIMATSPIFPFSYILSLSGIFYLGYVIPVSLVIFIFFIARLKKISSVAKWTALTIFLVGIIFSLGPYLKTRSGSLNIPLPHLLFYKWMPFFSLFREAGYWNVLAIMGGALIVGFCVSELESIIVRRFNSKTIFSATILAITIFPLLSIEIIPFRKKPLPLFAWDKRPEYYRWLEKADLDGARLEIPNDNNARFLYMAFSAGNPMSMISGHCSVSPRGNYMIDHWIEKFPDLESITAFSAMGVKWIMIHNDIHSEPAEWNISYIVRSPPYGLSATLKGETADEILYQVSTGGGPLRVVININTLISRGVLLDWNQFRYYLLKWNIPELVVSKESDKIPEGMIGIELAENTPNTIVKSDESCNAILEVGKTVNHDFIISAERMAELFSFCGKDEIYALMKNEGLNRIYFDHIPMFTNNNPLENVSKQDLDRLGIVFFKRVGNVDIYELKDYKNYYSGPLKLRSDFIPQGKTDDSPERIRIAINPTGRIPWNNPCPGCPLEVECNLRMVGSNEEINHKISFFPPPLIFPEETYENMWIIPVINRKSLYLLNCSGEGIEPYQKLFRSDYE